MTIFCRSILERLLFIVDILLFISPVKDIQSKVLFWSRQSEALKDLHVRTYTMIIHVYKYDFQNCNKVVQCLYDLESQCLIDSVTKNTNY